MTGTEIVTEAIENHNAVPVGSTIPPFEKARAFRRLCQIIAYWTTIGIEVPIVTWLNFSLAAGDDEYTIGSGGDKDTTRPDSVRGAFIRDSSGTDHQLKKLGENEFRRIASKGESGRPKGFWYHDTYPLGTLYVVPTPNTVETIHLFCSSPNPEPATTAAEVLVPRSFDLGLIHALTMELAVPYGKQVSRTLETLAHKSEAALKGLCAARRHNPPRLYVTSVGQAYSIIEGGAAPEALLLE